MHRSLLLFAAALAGCAAQPRIAPVAGAPPPAAASVASYGNPAVPPRLADGHYATPNRTVSAAGAVWHVRAGLNVAALSCRGPQEAALIAGYNALLQKHRAAFDQAYRALASEHGNSAAFDRAMTALYNYYALPAAQPGLCAAAQRVLAEAAFVPAGGLAAFAPAALTSLERPYATIFTAQQSWLAQRYARAGDGSISVAAVTITPPPPRLTVGPNTLRIP